jgi:hypothetical protein
VQPLRKLAKFRNFSEVRYGDCGEVEGKTYQ